MGKFNMLCIDDSEFSENAFDWYVENLHTPGDKLGLLHVHEMPMCQASMSVTMFAGPQFVEACRKEIDASVKNARAVAKKFQDFCKDNNINDSQIFLLTAKHSVGDTIVDVSTEYKADTIIMGQRGLNSITRTLLGSVSDYVLHHSHHIPVVIVPKRKE